MSEFVLVATEAGRNLRVLNLPRPILDPNRFEDIGNLLLKQIAADAEYYFTITAKHQVAEPVGIALMGRNAMFFTWPPPFIQGQMYVQLSPAQYFWVYIVEALHRARPALLELFNLRQILLIPHLGEHDSMLTLAWTTPNLMQSVFETVESNRA